MEVRLSSDKSLAIQSGALIEAICPQTDDPARCEGLMTDFWPVIGKTMYPVFIEGGSLCGAIGVCLKKRDLVKEWTCEDCVTGINDIGGIITSEETIMAVMDFLKVIAGVHGLSQDNCRNSSTSSRYTCYRKFMDFLKMFTETIWTSSR
jgi:hypothetical protein